MKPKQLTEKIALLNAAMLETYGALNERAIVTKFITTGLKILGADFGWSFGTLPDSQGFELLYVTPHCGYQPIAKPRKRGIVAKAFTTKKPQLVEDIMSPKYMRYDAKLAMKSVAVIPMTYQDASYGTLHYAWRKKHVFSKADEYLCRFLGNTAAQAFTIHRLYQNLKNFKATLDQTRDLILMFDAITTKIIYSNHGAQECLGWTEREFKKLFFSSLCAVSQAADLDSFLKNIKRVPGQSVMRDITLKTKTGKKMIAEALFQYSHIGEQQPQFMAVFRDVSERKKAEKQIQKAAFTDHLTLLPNRAYFVQQLEMQLMFSSPEEPFAVLFLDLDRFKLINDILGHSAGDTLIKRVADRLKISVKAKDLVARLGGDEFVIILKNIASSQDAVAVAKRILNQFKQPFTLENQEVYSSASIGLAFYPSDGQDAPTLLKAADRALYRVKEEGGAGFRQFRLGTAATAQHFELEKQLRVALERKEFVVYYQPQIDLRKGGIESCEALLRWEHPTLGLLGPDQFIALAEETGLIVDIGKWIIETVLAQQNMWRKAGLPYIRVGINLSARQLLQSDLVDIVRIQLNESRIKPQYIEFELTESMVMKNIELAMGVLEQFKNMGIKCAMDDFGKGYTSIDYLKRLPIDIVKIDKSFISGLPGGLHDKAIVNAIISLAHEMDKEVIAEGVETEAQWEYLNNKQCDFIQGFGLSTPMQGSDFARWFIEFEQMMVEEMKKY